MIFAYVLGNQSSNRNASVCVDFETSKQVKEWVCLTTHTLTQTPHILVQAYGTVMVKIIENNETNSNNLRCCKRMWRDPAFFPFENTFDREKAEVLSSSALKEEEVSEEMLK